MANIERLKFPALKITGENYTLWKTCIEMHFVVESLSDTLLETNTSTPQQKAKAAIFMKRHLDENLMLDYMLITDPAELWIALKSRFDYLQYFTLPKDRKSNKRDRSENTSKGKAPKMNNTHKWEDVCFKCGTKGHWSRTCRTPKHLCELYKKHIKEKGKEVNLMEHSETSDFTEDFDETVNSEK